MLNHETKENAIIRLKLLARAYGQIEALEISLKKISKK
jgi:hypothetical protein